MRNRNVFLENSSYRFFCSNADRSIISPQIMVHLFKESLRKYLGRGSRGWAEIELALCTTADVLQFPFGLVQAKGERTSIDPDRFYTREEWGLESAAEAWCCDGRKFVLILNAVSVGGFPCEVSAQGVITVSLRALFCMALDSDPISTRSVCMLLRDEVGLDDSFPEHYHLRMEVHESDEPSKRTLNDYKSRGPLGVLEIYNYLVLNKCEHMTFVLDRSKCVIIESAVSVDRSLWMTFTSHSHVLLHDNVDDSYAYVHSFRVSSIDAVIGSFQVPVSRDCRHVTFDKASLMCFSLTCSKDSKVSAEVCTRFYVDGTFKAFMRDTRVPEGVRRFYCILMKRCVSRCI